MRKIKFNSNHVAYLDEPLSIGDIIEVTDMHGMKYNLMVCINEDNSADCRSCAFDHNGISLCDEIIYAPFSWDTFLHPCNAALLNDGKKHTFNHCLYYKNMDSLLEDL